MQSLSPLGVLLEQGVTVIPNVLLKNYTALGLDELELAVVIHLLRFRQAENVKRPLLKELSQMTTLPEDQAKVTLMALEEKGLIRLASVQDDQGRWSKVYRLDGLYERLQQLFSSAKEQHGKENQFETLAKLFSQVSGLPMAPKHERMLLQWLYEYEFSMELMEYVLIECYERGGIWQKDWRIKSIMENLYSAGLNSMEEVRDWFLSYDQDHYWINKFAAVLGRPIKSYPEKRALKRWSSEWGFSDEMIISAMEKGCLAVPEPSFNYIESILKSWLDKGVTSPEGVEEESAARRSRKKQRRSKMEENEGQKFNIPKIDPDTGMVIT